MAIFRNIEKRSTRTSMDLTSQELIKALGLKEYNDGTSLNEAVYLTCLRILSDTVSKLPLKLYRDGESGTEKATDHYLYQLLKLRPNPYMSSSDFWKAVEFNRNHYGHSVVLIDYKKMGTIRGLYPLSMENIKIWVDDAGIINKDNGIWYIYTDKFNKEYKLKSSQVLHFKGMTRDGITGMAVKDYLMATIDANKSGQKYMESYFKNGLFAKGILNYTGDINDVNVRKMRERFESMANGIKNAGRILPVPLGFQFSTINASMADAQFLELQGLNAKNIASAFGIKMHQINDLERATHTNVEYMQKEFYIDTLQSILNMYEQELAYKLLLDRELKEGYSFKFNVDSILRSDLKSRFESYRVGIQAGFITPNEARQLEEMPSVENGDRLIVNGNMIPLEMVGEQYVKKGGDK